MTVQPLAIAEIVTDPETQPRVKMSVAAAIEYGDELHGGAEFPPVVVFFDGEKYWLADGNHRLTAHEIEDKTTIQAEVHEGGKRDAILYACGANAANGIRRTNADKRQAVERLLADAEWSKWSDREISRRAAVGKDLVAEMRSICLKRQIDTRTVTRNGTTYQQDTSNIGTAAHKPERPDELTDEEIARFQETSRKEGVTEERTAIVYGVISSLEDLAALDATPEEFWTTLCYEYSRPKVLKALPAASKWLHGLSTLAKGNLK